MPPRAQNMSTANLAMNGGERDTFGRPGSRGQYQGMQKSTSHQELQRYGTTDSQDRAI